MVFLALIHYFCTAYVARNFLVTTYPNKIFIPPSGDSPHWPKAYGKFCILENTILEQLLEDRYKGYSIEAIGLQLVGEPQDQSCSHAQLPSVLVQYTILVYQGCGTKMFTISLTPPLISFHLTSVTISDQNEALQAFLLARNPNKQHTGTLESYLITPIQVQD